jgi:hypothetical protein
LDAAAPFESCLAATAATTVKPAAAVTELPALLDLSGKLMDLHLNKCFVHELQEGTVLQLTAVKQLGSGGQATVALLTLTAAAAGSAEDTAASSSSLQVAFKLWHDSKKCVNEIVPQELVVGFKDFIQLLAVCGCKLADEGTNAEMRKGMLLELAAMSVADAMRWLKHGLKEPVVKSLVRFLLRAIITMAEKLPHSTWMLHGDLKCDNIMITLRGQFALADLGAAVLGKRPTAAAAAAVAAAAAAAAGHKQQAAVSSAAAAVAAGSEQMAAAATAPGGKQQAPAAAAAAAPAAAAAAAPAAAAAAAPAAAAAAAAGSSKQQAAVAAGAGGKQQAPAQRCQKPCQQRRRQRRLQQRLQQAEQASLAAAAANEQQTAAATAASGKQQAPAAVPAAAAAGGKQQAAVAAAASGKQQVPAAVSAAATAARSKQQAAVAAPAAGSKQHAAVAAAAGGKQQAPAAAAAGGKQQAELAVGLSGPLICSTPLFLPAAAQEQLYAQQDARRRAETAQQRADTKSALAVKLAAAAAQLDACQNQAAPASSTLGCVASALQDGVSGVLSAVYATTKQGRQKAAAAEESAAAALAAKDAVAAEAKAAAIKAKKEAKAAAAAQAKADTAKQHAADLPVVMLTSQDELHAVGVVTAEALSGGVSRLFGEAPPGALRRGRAHVRQFHTQLQDFLDSKPGLTGVWELPEVIAARGFIRGCCSVRQEERMSVQQLLQHDWLKDAAA